MLYFFYFFKFFQALFVGHPNIYYRAFFYCFLGDYTDLFHMILIALLPAHSVFPEYYYIRLYLHLYNAQLNTDMLYVCDYLIKPTTSRLQKQLSRNRINIKSYAYRYNQV